MNQRQIIKNTKIYVQKKMTGEATGHDWFHITRVLNLAQLIAKKEGTGNMFLIQLMALLHDIADWKFHDGDETIGPQVAQKWLETQGVQEKDITHICTIIQNISYKGGTNKAKMESIEGRIVQDADRLDALGAIGIGRAFAYGGFKKREMYDPDRLPAQFSSYDEYKASHGTTINHFYEKLLLLKDLMNTKTAKKIAEQRHVFMENFLTQFYQEWNGTDFHT